MKLHITNQLSPAANSAGSSSFQDNKAQQQDFLNAQNLAPAAFIMSNSQACKKAVQSVVATSNGHVWYDAIVYPHWND